MGIIYQITNKVNENFYVGKTEKSVEQRFKRHIANSAKGKTYLYKAMRKYGVENFTIKVLEESDTDDINELERKWIKTLSPTYNMTSGGDGGDTSKSPNYILGMSKRFQDPSKLATFGMLGKKQSEKFHDSIKKANNCPVECDGVYYESVGEAQKHYLGINIRKCLDNPRHPTFKRLREPTRRK